MKNVMIIMSLLPTLALAQMPPGFNAENMANMEKNMMSMMAGMEEMEKCMNSIDKNKIDQFEIEASRMEVKVAALCEQGKRSAAQDEAIRFSKKMTRNKEIQKMKACMSSLSPMMKSMGQTMPFEGLDKPLGTDEKNVCDQ